MPVNKMLLQELNQISRNRDADFRFSRKFWFLVQLPGEMPDSPLLRMPMKVTLRISEKQNVIEKISSDL